MGFYVEVMQILETSHMSELHSEIDTQSISVSQQS